MFSSTLKDRENRNKAYSKQSWQIIRDTVIQQKTFEANLEVKFIHKSQASSSVKWILNRRIRFVSTLWEQCHWKALQHSSRTFASSISSLTCFIIDSVCSSWSVLMYSVFQDAESTMITNIEKTITCHFICNVTNNTRSIKQQTQCDYLFKKHIFSIYTYLFTGHPFRWT